jgi:hypothetical protein
MTVRPLQPFDDPGMGFVNMIMRHQNEYPPRGDMARTGLSPLQRIVDIFAVSVRHVALGITAMTP